MTGWRGIGAMGRAGTAAALLALAAAAPAAAQEAAKPHRVVSLNLCADQLVLLLADRDAIASLTFLATDPTLSHLAAEARGLPTNHGRAEEVLALRPDLVISGAAAARPTVQLLRRLGVRVLDLPIANSFADVRARVASVAAALGVPGRGAALIAEMDARVADPGPPGAGRPVAVVYGPNGFTSGAGTLQDEALAAAGFDNLTDRLGMTGFGRLPIEELLLNDPDLIVLGVDENDAPSLARALLDHPALAKLGARTVTVPPNLWTCGAPFIAEAVERLRAAR